MLNFPDRLDKLDGFTSAAAATGITAITILAIRGQDVADDTLPSTDGLPQKEGQRDDAVGSWRSHLNFAREVVAQRLATALIMEDDADWDTSLKNQLQLFAQASQYITGAPPASADAKSSTKKSPALLSPYGSDWDLLWLGHCGSSIAPNDKRRYLIENDDTVAPPFRRSNQKLRDLVDTDSLGYANSTRVMYATNGGRCTHSYALSQQGARRVLATLSTARRFEPIDIALSKLCDAEARFKCLSVFPQVISTYEKLDNNDDNGGGEDKDGKEIRPLALAGWGTPNIVHSTRLNMVRLLAGNKENFERQWPDDPEVQGPAQTRTLNRDS